MATFTNIRLMHSLCICLCCSIRAHSDTASTSCISICAHILRMQLHLNAFGDRPRIKYADTMRYKLQECYQMHVECISCAHMRSECAVLPTVRMHSMRGGIKKLTYHGGELGRFKITSLDAKWTPPVFLWGADDNEWEPIVSKVGRGLASLWEVTRPMWLRSKPPLPLLSHPRRRCGLRSLQWRMRRKGLVFSSLLTTARSLRVLSRRLWVTTHRRALPRTRRGLSSGSSG